jgi:hypothetical protein
MKSQGILSSSPNVLPTPTTILTVDVKSWTQLTLEVSNNDGSQTLNVLVYRRCSDTGPWSLSPFDYLQNIAPGTSACADLDVSGTTAIQLRATASGIGLSARLAGLLVEGS